MMIPIPHSHPPSAPRSGVIRDGRASLSSCRIFSGATLTAHVRQAQLQSSALAFALLRSDGTVATWGTLAHGEAPVVSCVFFWLVTGT